MDAAQPLALHEDTVRSEWIDYNGHMNVAYYVLAFDLATDALFAHVGTFHDYRERHGQSLFTLEMHVTYERELVLGAPLRFTTQFLGLDDKRLHFIHAMHHATESYLAATNEALLINVDFATRRSAPFPPEVKATLAAIWDVHRTLPVPPQAGRRVALKGGRPSGA